MTNIIVIENMEFSYNQKKFFDHFNLCVKKGEFVSLVGPNGSGKSTLVRILLGLIKTDGNIEIDGDVLNKANISKILSKIGVVFENPDDQFVAETVYKDIAFTLENKGVKKDEIYKKVKDVAVYLGIEDILDKEPHFLSGGQKQLVALASALVIEPKILILDEALAMIDQLTREKIYKVLKELNDKKKMTIINITHDMDETLYSSRIVILNKAKIKMDGKTKEILKNEKEITKLGLSLPFMVELSIKLMYYGLIDDIILDMDEMVDILWK